MSKNFELLQEVGGNDELFAAPAPGAAQEDARGGAEMVDRQARERLLQNASLPNVLPPLGAPEATLGQDKTLESITAAQGEAFSGVWQSIYRSKRSLSLALGDTLSVLNAPGIAGELTDHVPRLPGLLGTLKSKARTWQSQVDQRINLPAADLAAMVREEEIKLVQRIFPLNSQAPPRVVLFSNPENSEGGAAVCARTAEFLAGRREGAVCVVDANFASPCLHKYFGKENGRGLAEAIAGKGSIQEFVQQIADSDLWLLPSGKTQMEPGLPAVAESLQQRVSELRDACPYVLIWGAPLRLDSGAMLLSQWADGVVLVIEANRTRRELAKRAKENLLACGASLLGVVLNNRTFPVPQAIYERL